MGQGRRHFTDEFKQEAIALLVSSGRFVARINSRAQSAPRSNILREANVLRPAKLEHAVQRGDSNGHLSRLPAPGP
jgi:hypothetical protein